MKFVVFTYARSGSTWLVNTINNIPDVTCYDELFTIKETMYRAGEKDFPRFLEWRESHAGFPSVWHYLNQLYAVNKKTGFKLIFHQAKEHWEFLPYGVFKKVGVIHLVRQNTLDLVLSLLLAQNRGKFHYKDDEKIPSQAPVRIDPAFLIKRINKVHQNHAQAKKMLKFFKLRSIDVYYEDLLEDKRNFKPIWDFIEEDYDKDPPKWQTQKILTQERAQSIQNFEEVERAMRAAGYEHFLNA